MSEYVDPVVLLKSLRRLEAIEADAADLDRRYHELLTENGDLANRLGIVETILEDAIEAVRREPSYAVEAILRDALECARNSDWCP